MKLPRAEAVRECKAEWGEIKASGLSKHDFLYTTLEGREWLKKDYAGNCPLCETGFNLGKSCPQCPLVQQYGKICFKMGYRRVVVCPPQWFEAIEGLKEEMP